MKKTYLIWQGLFTFSTVFLVGMLLEAVHVSTWYNLLAAIPCLLIVLYIEESK